MARTKMECERCHGFSSTRICWSCSQRPDAIDHALLESYRKDAERYRWLRDKADWIVGPCHEPDLYPDYGPGELDEAVDAQMNAVIDGASNDR